MRGDNADDLEVMIRPPVVTINRLKMSKNIPCISKNAGGLFIDKESKMSYISDWKHSEQTEEDYITYHNAVVEDNARDRWEREHEYDDYEDYEDEE